MRQLTDKEIHDCLLNILKDVDEFCRQNGLRYSLAYGTLIGAVRHHGFIPWDDDIDIQMPRPDFERFIREYGRDLAPGTDASITLSMRKNVSSISSQKCTIHIPYAFRASQSSINSV